MRYDVPSFGLGVGEPVAGPHVAHTWRLGRAVGSIAGHVLRRPDRSSGMRGGGYSHDAAPRGMSGEVTRHGHTIYLQYSPSPKLSAHDPTGGSEMNVEIHSPCRPLRSATLQGGSVLHPVAGRRLPCALAAPSCHSPNADHRLGCESPFPRSMGGVGRGGWVPACLRIGPSALIVVWLA